MEFGRIILLVDGEKHAIIKKKWLTKFFVAGDVLSFVAQCLGAYDCSPGDSEDGFSANSYLIGGGMLSKQDASSAKTGKLVIELGLGIQILFFGFFLFNILIFWRRIIRSSTARSECMPWKKHSTVLLTAGAVILIRCIYRVIEYIQGEKGALQSKEVYLYVLDAGLMLIVMLIFHFYHPSEVGSLLKGGRVARLFKMESVEKWGETSHLSNIELNAGLVHLHGK